MSLSGQCQFSHACIFPVENGSGYCAVHEQLIAQHIRGTRIAAVESQMEMSTPMSVLHMEMEKSESRKESRQMAMRRLYKQGWPRKRIEQVFETDEETVLDVLGDILKPEHKPYSWWAT